MKKILVKAYKKLFSLPTRCTTPSGMVFICDGQLLHHAWDCSKYLMGQLQENKSVKVKQ